MSIDPLDIIEYFIFIQNYLVKITVSINVSGAGRGYIPYSYFIKITVNQILL